MFFEMGRAFMAEVKADFPCPGAKPYFLIEDAFENSEWLSDLIRITAQALLAPSVKRSKKKRPVIWDSTFTG